MTDTERTEQSVRIMLFSHVMVFYFNFILTPVEGEWIYIHKTIFNTGSPVCA